MSVAQAKDLSRQDPNLLTLGDGIQILLPQNASDLAAQAAFSRLTADERHSFYVKRRFLIQHLTRGLGRPGLRSGFRWVKDRIFRLAPGESSTSDVASPLEWQATPETLSPQSKAFIDAAVTSLVENMWQNSVSIAKHDGLGLTFVGGGIWNTSVPFGGFALGRSISLDIGVDFQSQTGYVRLLSDAQSLRRPGLSLDIGPMFDVLVHVTDPRLEVESEMRATHVKLPMIGCFRTGESYHAWGMQLGVNVFEMVGLWLAATGMPIEGAGLITGTRAVGLATVYSTDLQRRVLKVNNISEITMRRIGFGKLFDLLHQDGCGPYLR